LGSLPPATAAALRPSGWRSSSVTARPVIMAAGISAAAGQARHYATQSDAPQRQ